MDTNFQTGRVGSPCEGDVARLIRSHPARGRRKIKARKFLGGTAIARWGEHRTASAELTGFRCNRANSYPHKGK
jgi:hypothetical protein